MTQDDKEALKEFMRGAASVVGIVVVGIIIISVIGWADAPPEGQPSTNVVGQYKECDIIQWHYGALAEYKYFLYCPNEREI